MLDSITISNLRSKESITDARLDALIKYYKERKEEPEKKYGPKQFISGSQTYYYIDSTLLP